MLLRSLMPSQALDTAIADGYVAVRVHPEDPSLKILNYTDKAQYDNHWTAITMQCRGLIVLGETWDDAIVVARPFDKFFNLGQAQAPVLFPDTWVTAYDKMDGSLGILYPAPDGGLSVATRGSFTSEQALHATKVYRSRYAGQWDEHAALNGHITYLFEIVYPENRIVLDYGDQDDLVLLASRRVSDGAYDSPGFVAQVDGWSGPVTPVLHRGTMAEVMAAPDRPNAEGMVLVLANSEGRVKVKQEDYVALHKMVFGLNERAVWEQMSEGKALDAILEGLPDEFHDWVTKVYEGLAAQHSQIWREALYAYNLADGLHGDRKAFAEYAKKTKHPGLLFGLLDGDAARVRAAIWKMLRPEGSKPYTHAATAA